MAIPLFPLLFVVVENGKTRSGNARLHARVAMRKACSVCELARVLVNRGKSMNIATFSTRDLREQGCKPYVTSYHANEELVIPQMFSHELLQ